MPRTRFREESMSSLSRRRSGTHRVRQLVITSLATLGTVLLFGLANHGSAVIDAVPPVVESVSIHFVLTKVAGFCQKVF